MNTFNVFTALTALCLGLAACGSDDPPASGAPASDVPVTLNAEVKARGFAAPADTATFVFDEAAHKALLDKAAVTRIDGVDLRGSFTAWGKKDGFALKKSATESGIWFLTQPLSALRAPGNSGHPEFKFVVTGTVAGKDGEAWIEVPAETPLGYAHFGNRLLALPGSDMNLIIRNAIAADTVKSLADFNLSTDAGQAALSNFRLAPGTSRLYRGYHPVKKSYPQLDTESARLERVNRFLAERQIKSMITLSGDEAADPALNESVAPYLQAIRDAQHNLFLNVSYNSVYFRSDSDAFGQMMTSIVAFIVDPQHEAPFMVHCRLGTDRTGVIVAVLSGLAGATWDEIAADYQRSNAMGIREFRDYKLLQYALERMLRLESDTLDEVDLRQRLTAYFVERQLLTAAQIDALAAKIK